MISLYDTLKGEVRRLEPRERGRVGLYACGPTVYDHPHLGHARSALTYDVLRRYLEWRGLEVRHVANVTDIDDKIIDRARREGRTESEVAAEWEAVYVEVMDALGILAPHRRPRATEWVTEMVDFVGRIVDAGKAYTTPTGVYLRVRDVAGYGDLVHRGLDDLRASAGARVEVDEAKEDPLDFALWKAAKPDEPSWPSPWGPGRPGWHIECVAMSLGILGDDFDIHGGGNDLVFPHHTNERAEALAVGRSFARHWMHNAMLNVEGTKMAKSLGNYRTVADLLAEHPLNGRAFRLLVLQTHYRKTMEVNPELMASARSAVQRLDALARRVEAVGARGVASEVSHARFEQYVDRGSGDRVPEDLASEVSHARFEQSVDRGSGDRVPEDLASEDWGSGGRVPEDLASEDWGTVDRGTDGRATDPAESSDGVDGETDEPVVPESRRSPVDQVLDRLDDKGADRAVDVTTGPLRVDQVLARVDAKGAERMADRLEGRFRSAMDRDMGTPLAVSRIFEALHRANAALDEGSVGGPVLARKVIDLAGVLGLQAVADSQDAQGGDAIERLVARRQAAREAKDWATADALRDELSARGVIVEDTPAGPVWRWA